MDLLGEDKPEQDILAQSLCSFSFQSTYVLPSPFHSFNKSLLRTFSVPVTEDTVMNNMDGNLKYNGKTDVKSGMCTHLIWNIVTVPHRLSTAALCSFQWPIYASFSYCSGVFSPCSFIWDVSLFSLILAASLYFVKVFCVFRFLRE